MATDRITPASKANASTSDGTTDWPSLEPLAPRYEPSEHEVYFKAIEDALTGRDSRTIQNIALSGSYGVGKSSILQKVVDAHEGKVVQLSFSSIGLDDLSAPAGEASPPPLSRTNRIQREIVKQLLYCEDPSKMPGSRYRRIGGARFWRQVGMATLASLIITLIFYLSGWTDKLVAPAKPHSGSWIVANVVVFVVAICAVFALERLLHNRLRIEKLSAGPATISLVDPAGSFFDQYLDEIVYFFEVTGRDIVIFEDIDRFGDPHIFETLRALNTLLNRAGQLKGLNIRFIYAIRDSIFEELGRRAALEGSDGDLAAEANTIDPELARTNRTKFFDLVIPIVPFITHRSARDLIAREMKGLGVSPALIDLAGRHLVDMRLIRNVRNEFLVFRQRVRCDARDLALKVDGLFAMLLYKNMYLADFEAIKFGTSKLDSLYRDARLVVEQNLARLGKEDAVARQRITKLDSVGTRSAKLGSAALGEIKRLERRLNAIPPPSRGTNRTLTHNGQTLTDSDLKTADFWHKFLATDGHPLQVTIQTPSGTVSAIIRLQDLSEALGESLSLQDWEESDRHILLQQLERNDASRRFLIHADIHDLMSRDEFMLSRVDGRTFSLSEVAFDHLDLELIRQLVAQGYIDRNFTLYTSTYHDERVSTQAMNFIIHNVNQNTADTYFPLEGSDVEAILRECGVSVLAERSMHNIDILDYLVEAQHPQLDILIRSLTAFGQHEQSFLMEYFADGTGRRALARGLARLWRRTYLFIVTEAEVEEAVRARLLDASLEGISGGVDYEVDDALREYFEEHYLELSAFTSSETSSADAALIAELLDAMDARLSSLHGLVASMRLAVVDKGCYRMTRANLVVALDGLEDLALDAIRARDETVYDQVLARMSEYLTGLREKAAATHTVESPDAFEAVIEDVLVHSPGLLLEVLAAASPNCMVSNLADVSRAAWPTLADTKRFPANVRNVTAYLEIAGGIDSHLVGLLGESTSIIVADGDSESDKVALAQQLLAARDVLPDPGLRTQLVASLRLEDWLPASSVQPESGQFIGLLIERQIADDTAETLALTLDTDWETREFAIGKSKKFASFMTPALVPEEDVASLMLSDMVDDAVKSAIVERFREFVPHGDRGALTEIARFALRTATTVSPPDLVPMAEAGVPSEQVVELLRKSLPSLGLTGLVPVLDALGKEYAAVAVRGWRKPNLPNTESHLALVRRLEELGVVSSYREVQDEIKVNLKRP